MQAFRDANGRDFDSFKLTLFLADLICEEQVSTVPGCEEVRIEITAKQRCDINDGLPKNRSKKMKEALTVRLFVLQSLGQGIGVWLRER